MVRKVEKQKFVSAMPENLLDPYTPDQIAGLIALLLAGPGLQ